MSRRAVAPLLLLVALAAPVVSGCGDDDDGGGGTVAAALDELVAPTGDEASSRLLIAVADLAAVAEANGVTAPGDDADGGDLAAWVTGRAEPLESPAPGHVPYLDAAGLGAGSPEEVEEVLGWSPADADVVAQVSAPPYSFAVVAGDVGRSTLDDADGLDDLGDDVWSAGTGEDFASIRDEASAIRPIGVPVRSTAEDGRLALSPSTPAIAAWRDGDATTLADDEDLAAAAAALDDGGALSALLASPPPSGRDLTPRSAPVRIEAEVSVVGIGWGVDDGDAAITVAYVLADEDDADEAAEQVEAVWSEGVGTRSREPLSDAVVLDGVEVRGTVVVARLHMADDVPPGVLEQMLTSADLPFALSDD